MNIDRLSIKGPADANYVAIDDTYGFHLKWRSLSAPTPKTRFDEIPGMNGSLDSTEEFGEVFYNDRTLSLDCIHPGDSWYEHMQNFVSAYHGQNVKIAFSNDPNYYWTGRLFVTGYSAKDHSLQMSATVYPYKFKKTLTTVSKTGSGSASLTNGRMKVVPDVTFTAACTLAWGTNTKQLSASSYPQTVKIAGLELEPNSTLTVTLTGSATVTFSYREGAL